jgi:hypothetical protein
MEPVTKFMFDGRVQDINHSKWVRTGPRSRSNHLLSNRQWQEVEGRAVRVQQTSYRARTRNFPSVPVPGPVRRVRLRVRGVVPVPVPLGVMPPIPHPSHASANPDAGPSPPAKIF